MRHARRYMAGALGLLVGGCALLPHVGKAPVVVGGPVTLKILGLPAVADRSVQASTVSTSNIPSGTKRQVEIKAYGAHATYSLASLDGSLASTDSGVSLATASIASGATSASVTMPAMPAGAHVLVVSIYSSHANMCDPASGVAYDHARYYLTAQGEARITSIVGVPTTTTLRLTQVLGGTKRIDVRVPSAATTSVAISGVANTSPGMYLRLGYWNPYEMLFTGGNAAYQHKMRVVLIAASPYGWAVASTSTAAGYWTLGDVRAPQGFASASFAVPDEVSTGKVWNWGNATRTAIFTDVDFTDADASYQTKYTVNGDPYGSNVTLFIPTALCPTGYTMYLTDRMGDMSGSVSGSLR